MNVIVSGSTGLIGNALCARLMSRGHHIRRLVRPGSLTAPNLAPLGTLIQWDPSRGTIDKAGLEHADVVIHLAGENIAGRWTARKKARIHDSRVLGTDLLARSLAELVHPPELFISASAAGFYGDRADQVLTEASPSGTGFLAEVCRRWEAAADPARQRGIRVVHPRIAMVLSPDGGALTNMLPIFKFGLGGVMGAGDQYWPWISIDDCTGALATFVQGVEIEGPVNLVAPESVTCRAFTQTLAHHLKRPAFWLIPEAFVNLAFGEMGSELLLASTRQTPARLQQLGYVFEHPTLDKALDDLL